jgi:hypothetical protein
VTGPVLIHRPDGERMLVTTVGGVEHRIPLWEAEAFARWFNPDRDRDGVDPWVGRPLRAPGA